MAVTINGSGPIAGTTTLNGFTVPTGLGKLLQVVEGAATSQASSNSTTYVSSGVTATITPTYSTSKILVFAMTSATTTGSNISLDMQLFRGTVSGTAIGTTTTMLSQTASNICIPVFMFAADSPSTTSAQTYTLGYKSGNSSMTAYINAYSSAGVAKMILVEVAA